MGDLNLDLSAAANDQMSGEGSWAVLPDGWYRMMASEAIVKSNKSGTGDVLWLKLSHLAPDIHSYERVFLNVRHSTSAQAQEIGQGQLKALARAINHPNPNRIDDTSELLNQPLMVKLGSESENGKYSDRNGMVQTVTGYRSVAEHAEKGEPNAATPASPASQPPPDDGIPF